MSLEIFPVLKTAAYSFTYQEAAGVGRHEAIHIPSGTWCGLMLIAQAAWFGVDSVTMESRETVTGTHWD